MCAPRARFPLIGVGGIDSGGAALSRIRAGASLIQVYSSLVYKGHRPRRGYQARSGLDACCAPGAKSLSEIVGADAATITAEDWPV